ncbi:MAG: 1,3-beta-galactosyl-N-acetylhexosamine phosphorylase [Bifidobacteriaceae bacterium]|jgi:1,3-beta-galactosyl-N-acetylhexosamine phosphorylase|nr:1,3-beta-galactosyl-N-acetylhexosamine phosphorylase [Bifidobacteriaceae bacterium]
MGLGGGRVTLPTEIGAEAVCLELMRRLGADAVRNSDGTEVPPEFTAMGLAVYSKYFVNRGDLDFARENPALTQQLYLMSRPVTATIPELAIAPLDGFFAEQFRIDLEHAPKRWWEVRDRTSGAVVDTGRWNVTEADGTVHVKITDATPFHEYTVAFLAWNIWEPVQMYNHLTNGWGDKPHEPALDAFHPVARRRALERLREWLAAQETTTVVRFTTFLYQFALIYNAAAKEKFVDWFSYAATVSPAALDAFAQEYGYRLTPEDFVDEGYYHTAARPLTARWRDWMEFVAAQVRAVARELVGVVHEAGREAMMFLGDQWIGVEPYGPGFAAIGLDAVVGSVGDGATMRMIADIPGVRYTEGRLLPYFFPDTFHPGGNPAGEALTSWLSARRAMLRRPVDRIGWGGYPSLAAAHPEFVDVAARIADEFRELHARRGGAEPWTAGGKVAVLNEWGALRAWLTYTVAHGKPHRFTEPYAGLLEALAGLPFDVTWLSFAELTSGGVPDGIGAVVNAGPAGTAFSGGAAWADARLAERLREWTAGGGFFLGVGEPTALVRGGRTFQLADVLGVDQEVGFSLPTSHHPRHAPDHPVAAGLPLDFTLHDAVRAVHPIELGAVVVREQAGDTLVAVHEYGAGRAAYLAGLPYDAVNARLLHRVLAWGMGLDAAALPYLMDNPLVDVAAYEGAGWVAAANASLSPQAGSFLDGSGRRRRVTLAPGEIAWLAL